jgi:hypothetical protein
MRVMLPSHTEHAQLSELAHQELDVWPSEIGIAGDHVVHIIMNWAPAPNNIRLFNWKKKEFARLPEVSK